MGSREDKETMVDVSVEQHSTWLTNTYLLRDTETKTALLIDAGLPPERFHAQLEGYTLQAILLTHTHLDHVDGLELWLSEYSAPAYVHEKECWPHSQSQPKKLLGGETLQFGAFKLRVLHSGAHCSGHCVFVVNERVIFSGDILFRESVGGTLKGGPGAFEKLKESVERLLQLPDETIIHPGHSKETTVGHEASCNPFVLAWRNIENLLREKTIIRSRPAELLLEAKDYDGGTKALVFFGDSHEFAIIPGSWL